MKKELEEGYLFDLRESIRVLWESELSSCLFDPWLGRLLMLVGVGGFLHHCIVELT
jgi:hypothetical protein